MQVFRDGPAPMISAVCRDIGLTRTIDRMVAWDEKQCTLSPGLRVEAMIINALTRRCPLYRMDHFFHDVDVAKLFGPAVTPRQLNDDAMGRALDKVAEANAKEVYATVALQAVCRENISLEILHADTTSVSVQGAYEDNTADDDVWLTYGHSKDKRPDLKQFMYGLLVTSERVPAGAEVLSGNTSDKTWNQRMIRQLRERLGQTRGLVYVADSSLVCSSNLKTLQEQGIHFISRMPATFSLADQLRDRAWERDQWHPLGTLSQRKGAAIYRMQACEEVLKGESYRFVVVHSSHLDGRKARSIERRLQRLEQEGDKALHTLATREFACEPDAHEAWRSFLSRHAQDFFDFTYTVKRHTRRKSRSAPGRPPKDFVPETETAFSLTPVRTRNEPAIEEWKARASCFVLMTNLPQDARWTDEAIVREYKEQSVVEQHFAFIKNPKIVGPMYVKNPARVQALAYVLLMAVLVYSILERRVRRALKESGIPLEVYDRRTSLKPTGRSILEHFLGVNVVLMDGNRFLPKNLGEMPRLLRLLGLSENIYLSWTPP